MLNTERFELRLSKSLKSRLKKLARQEYRTTSDYIRRVLEKHTKIIK